MGFRSKVPMGLRLQDEPRTRHKPKPAASYKTGMQPPTTTKQFTSWSYSRYKDYSQCPARAAYKHLHKMAEPQSAPMARGEAIGKGIEDYLLKKRPALPLEVHKTFKPMFADMRKQQTLFVEEMWGFDKNWNPVPWNDWNNCWLRVKVDNGWVDAKKNYVVIIDNKTGKYRPEDNDEYMQQIDLYVAAGAAKFPGASEYHSRLAYTDHGILHPQTAPVVASEKEAIAKQKVWDKRVKPMFADKRFLPTPGYYCGWCPYSKNKGGPCRY